MLTDFQKVARGASIIKLRTTLADGTHDVWVDTPQVPAGKVRSYLNASILGDTVNTGGRILHCFVCEPNMAPNSPPLRLTGLIDFAKVGCRIGGPGGANPTISQVQHSAAAFGAAGGTLAFPGNNTAKNAILVLLQASKVGVNTDPNPTFTVSDTNGNKYFKLNGTPLSTFNGTNNSYRTSVFYAYNIKGGANSVTVAATGTQNAVQMVIVEDSNGLNLNPIVSFANFANDNSATPVATQITVTVTQPNQMVVLYYGNGGSPTGFPPAGFSNPENGYAFGIVAVPGVYTYGPFTSATTQQLWGIVLSNAPIANSLATGGSNRRAPIMLHENQFLRFMTGNVAAGAPPAGTVFDISLVYSDMDVCEVCP